MTTINDHILFPFTCQWRERPRWSRAWQTEDAAGVLGNVTRFGHRAAPRRSLTFQLVNLSLPELGELDDAIRAAKKSGLACAPFHGRAGIHAQPAESNIVQLVETGWPWRVNDYIYLRAPDDSFEIGQVTVSEIDGDWRRLTLADEFEKIYEIGTLAWPLIFGKFSCDTQAAKTPRYGPVRITITELVSPASTQVGEVTPPAGAGIGVMKIEEDFAIA